MMLALCGGRILVGGQFSDDHAVLVDGDTISSVVPASELPPGVDRYELDGKLLLPGFIDIQVNGGGGVLFNDDPTVDAIRSIGEAHRQFGTTGFLPTLISDDLDTIRRAIAAVDSAISQGVPGVLGIHIEGPFLNVARRGIHDPARITSLDEEGFKVVTSLHQGKTLLTLAPECTTPALIRRLSDIGVLVAAGHSNASYRQVETALAHGLTGFTHLFNAMSQLTAREPGVVGAALMHANSWCSIIADGFHVDQVTMRLALRCKANNAKFLLVTDAMPSVGTTTGSFVIQGETITVVDGVCRSRDGTLAGTNLDMAQAVWRAAAMFDVTLADAVAMASSNPACFLGISDLRGRIAQGLQADLVALDDTGTVHASWIAGRRQGLASGGAATDRREW